MKMICIRLCMLTALFLPFSVIASDTKRYVIPPTSSTTADVPTISDEAMEKCIKIYNEAKWISEKLNRTSVDSYNEKSVKSYNKMVSQHRKKQDTFNHQCAGKQSYSACKAAQKLNQEQGLPYKKCIIDK